MRPRTPVGWLSRHSASRMLWRGSLEGSLGVRPNQLVLTIQPNEGVSLSLGAKIPGTRMIIRPVIMEFQYGTSFLSQSPDSHQPARAKPPWISGFSSFFGVKNLRKASAPSIETVNSSR